MLAIRLPEAIENRLAELAEKTGRTKTYYAREAIMKHLEDMEDYYLAEKSYTEFVNSNEEAIDIEDLDLGLED